MQIPVSYHGPYHFHRHRDSKGHYEITAIQDDLNGKVRDEVAHSSGIYIFMQKRSHGKLRARYVGVNTNHHLLDEAMKKKNVLKRKVLDEQGSRWLFLIACDRPLGTHQSRFRRALLKLERALIRLLFYYDHPLVNKQHKPKDPRFDFSIKRGDKSTMTFRRLVHQRPPRV